MSSNNDGSGRLTPPVHPCEVCGAHEGWKFAVMEIVRCTVITLTILLIGAYLVYAIYTDEESKNMENLEKEFMEYEKQVRESQRGDAEFNKKAHGIGWKDVEKCVRRNEAGRIDQGYIRRLVEEELEVFDLDRTGKPDFAMAAMGGSIVSTAGTCDGSVEIFGIPSAGKRGPETILDPSVVPGDCWSFRGSKGSVTVQLPAKIIVTEVALEHIPREISPSGDISSAPRIFSVAGLETPVSSGHTYGVFVYSDKGASVQSFSVKNPGPPIQYVRFDFQENHGNPDYTCVYRIRVHGTRI